MSVQGNKKELVIRASELGTYSNHRTDIRRFRDSRDKLFRIDQGKSVNRELRNPKGMLGREWANSETLVEEGSNRIFGQCNQNYFVTTLATHWMKQLSLVKENDWEILTFWLFGDWCRTWPPLLCVSLLWFL